jgi:hypothetical protein
MGVTCSRTSARRGLRDFAPACELFNASEYVQEALLTGCVLYVNHGVEETEIVSRRSFIDDGGARVK